VILNHVIISSSYVLPFGDCNEWLVVSAELKFDNCRQRDRAKFVKYTQLGCSGTKIVFCLLRGFMLHIYYDDWCFTATYEVSL